MSVNGIGFDEAEELLLAGEFQDCRQIRYSSNYVYLANLCGPKGETFAAVYKPHRGESPLWDFPDGLYRREGAAYQLSRLLDWPFIPPTVIRDGPEGIGSLQLFIAHDPASHFFTQREDAALVPQLQRICVFDVVANNADRKGGHCLLDAEGRVWGIDHGLCFHQQYKLRSVMWDWAREPVPAEWLADLARVAEAVANEDDQTKPFRELVEPAEVKAYLARSARLIEAGRFPMPGAERHYPWPLV